MALATPSEPGLLFDVGTIGSPGWVTSDGARKPSSSTSAICMLLPPGPTTVGKSRRYCRYGVVFSKRIVFLKNRAGNAGTVPLEIMVKLVPSYEPSNV